jgi:hypothetical protein
VVSRVEAITSSGIGPGNSGDQPFAETRLSARHQLTSLLPTAGHALAACSIADTGFAGQHVRFRW